MKPKKLALLSLLTAIALTIFMVEAQIPLPVPVPGVKLGLSNIVTTCAVFALGPGSAAAILTVRVILGAVFSGQLMSLLYSASGGALGLLVSILLRKLLTRKQIWVAGVLSAMAHNVGQILAAILVTRTPELMVYLPVLLCCGILAGLFTGLAAQALINHLHRLFQT